MAAGAGQMLDWSASTDTGLNKLRIIRYYHILIITEVNIPLIPARLVISYHNLNVSDALFSQLELRHQLVLLVMEVDHLSHGNLRREGGLDTLVVGRTKIRVREMKQEERLLVTCIT
jgi:hypothetical protein